jgi:hypothetical protein
MSWSDDRKLLDYLNRCDDPFRVVVEIAQEARMRAESTMPCMLHSVALTWVMTGVRPEEADRRQAKAVLKKKPQLDDYLYQIDDADIRDAVRQSFYATQRANHLEFKYEKIVNISIQSRVRVLTRMIYDKLKDD